MSAQSPEPVTINVTYTSAEQLNQLKAQWETAQDAAADTLRPAIEQLLTKFVALATTHLHPTDRPRAITQRKDQP